MLSNDIRLVVLSESISLGVNELSILKVVPYRGSAEVVVPFSSIGSGRLQIGKTRLWARSPVSPRLLAIQFSVINKVAVH